MKIGDFGTFDGEVVLCGGPYSNLSAVDALDRAAAGRPVICTGDTVAYGAEPVETVARIRALGWRVVAGNTERQVEEGSDDCGCGFAEGSTCDRLAGAWWPYLLSAATPDMTAWFATLPDIATFVQRGRRYAVIHAGATANNLFLWPSTEPEDYEREIAALEARVGPVDGVVAGHSGIAFHRRIGRHHWINAGAIGLPPHDGRTETRYAVLKNGEIVIHRLGFDNDAAREAMARAGLTQGYHDTMTTGVWPSEDILPPELRR